MMDAMLIVSTWEDGLTVIQQGKVHRELPGRPACGLARTGNGSILAIIDRHRLCSRSRQGIWTDLARSASALACCAVSRGDVFVGSADEPRLFRLEHGGALTPIEAFDATPGREYWRAGGAFVNGEWLGPPLGIRSLAATCDGSGLLVNVHVGGIPRSTDRGATWQATIAVETDVHEVVCHPARPDVAAAAAGTGLCLSLDGGTTWTHHTDGLRETYCSAVAFAGDDLLVAASSDHFAREGAVYRRPIHGRAPLRLVGGGLPEWTDGIVDTAGIAVDGPHAAVVDRAGNLYVSQDGGHTWSLLAEIAPGPSAAVFV